MTFETGIGTAAHRQPVISEEALIGAGYYTKTIYLNGGSDTRRGVREYYRERYRGSNSIEVVECGWCVIIRQRRDVT